MDQNKEITRLKKDLDKARSQLYIFYELAQVMRTTLRLEEISYIILTGLTAHHGLGFNRALLFLIDNRERLINGFMGIGPVDSREANDIWKAIENQKMDLYSLIKAYHGLKQAKTTPKFMEVTRSLSFPLSEEAMLLYTALYEITPLHINVTEKDMEKYADDPLVKRLNLKEFVIASLWSKDSPMGVILVDNCITAKPVTEEEIKIFSMFINQAAGAIENSKIFENTLEKAHTDSLTGLWNYGYFQYKLDEELVKAREKDYPVSIIMLDLDDFKKFNDTFGHQAGDGALRTVSRLLKENSRKIDVAARYGGEEFALILPHTNKDEALVIAERIRKAVEAVDIMGWGLTASVGVTCFKDDQAQKSELIERADEALYQAKNQGKNRVFLN